MHSKLLLCSFFASVALVSACATEEDLGQRSSKPDGGSTTSDDTTAGGSGTTVGTTPVCEGDPLPCNGTPEETTCTKRGCTYAPKTCTGNALGCGTFSQTTCNYVPGCSWRQIFGNYTCAGQAVACDERALTGNCGSALGKSGCREEGGCSGTPKPCSDDRAPCSPGCKLRPY
jgi:hypothetical protein